MGSSSSKEKTNNNETKEVAIHGDPIPERIIKKLYNSIVRIKFTNSNKDSLNATGFFMKIILNDKEINLLITCKHVISILIID